MKFKRQQILTFAVKPALADRLQAFVLSEPGKSLLDATSERHVDQFFRSGSLAGKQKSKLMRVRQEIDSGRCFADLKTLKSNSARLHRSLISRHQVESLLLAPEDTSTRPSVWKLNRNANLSASTEAHYHRTTFSLASSIDRATRLTLDQSIRCRLLSGGNLPDYYDLASTCLLTMKFVDALPAIFKRLVYEFRLQPQRTWLAQLCGEALTTAPHSVNPLQPADRRSRQTLKLGAHRERSVA